MKELFGNKKGLSPVIATVILISVTIVVAVSVAYWMGAITGGYTSFEQIELPTVYAKYDANLFPSLPSKGGWKVYIDLKNTGSAAATINNIFLNSQPLKDFTTGIRLFAPDEITEILDISKIDIKVPNGGSAKVVIYISETIQGCSSGTRIDLKLHSAAGRDYPAQVKLP